MSGSLNKVLIIGRLGKDPETKYTESGKTVCKFSLATDEQWKDSAGEKQSKTTWVNCVAWGKTAEICGQYLSKGKQVYVEGKLSVREWEKDGVKRTATEVIIDKLIMLGSGKEADKPAASKASSYEDDDTPF